MSIFENAWQRRTLLQILAAAAMVPFHPLIVAAGWVVKAVSRG
jgi:hypothetical protein